MEIVTGTQAYSMRANWKLLVENSMVGTMRAPRISVILNF